MDNEPLWPSNLRTRQIDDVTYFPSYERQDVHLPRLALLDRGDDEAGAAKDNLPPGPAVDGQLQLPFADVVHPRQLDPLGALDVLGFPWITREREGRGGEIIVWLAEAYDAGG